MIPFRILNDRKGPPWLCIGFLNEHHTFSLQPFMKGCHVRHVEGQRLRLADNLAVVFPVLVGEVEDDFRFRICGRNSNPPRRSSWIQGSIRAKL